MGLVEYIERTVVEVEARLGERTPGVGMPMAGVHLSEIEARLLLAAARSTVERIREVERRFG